MEQRGTLSNRAEDIPWWFVFGFGFGRELEGEVVELTISCEEVATMVWLCSMSKEEKKRDVVCLLLPLSVLKALPQKSKLADM